VQGVPAEQQGADLLQQHDHDGQHDADRAGEAHVLLQEGLADHEQRGDGGHAARAAAHAGQGQDHARVLDGVDDHEHQQQVDGAHDQRQLDLGELGPPADAVDLARLVDLLADVLQLGQVGQHRERAHPREAPHDAGGDDQVLVAQPGRHLARHEDAAPGQLGIKADQQIEQAGAHQELVQEARGGLKEEGAPDQHHHQAGNDHGHHEQRAVEELHALAAAAVDADRHQQSGDHLDDVPAAQDQGQLERVPEVGPPHQVFVVLPAHPLRDVRPIPAEEAVDDAAGRRVVLEQRDQQQRGENEEIDLPMMLELTPFDAARRHAWRTVLAAGPPRAEVPISRAQQRGGKSAAPPEKAFCAHVPEGRHSCRPTLTPERHSMLTSRIGRT
jgi:hypothetical protein